MVKVKIKRLRYEASIPEYQSSGAAGMDLHACITENMLLNPGEIRAVPTGIAIELPEGYEAQIRPRSGLALKHGLTVLNTPGTIDPDYRGEVMVILANLGDKPIIIGSGMRIAQMVITRFEKAEWEVVDELSNTERGEAGLGSTGL